MMGALLAPGKRTVNSCLRMTGRAESANLQPFTRSSTARAGAPLLSPNDYPHSAIAKEASRGPRRTEAHSI